LVKGEAESKAYKPRTGKVGTNMQFFSEDMIEYIKLKCKDMLLFFG
jgi:hypothetical protein